MVTSWWKNLKITTVMLNKWTNTECKTSKWEPLFEKSVENELILQNTWFSQLKWVANKMPGQAAKTLKDKILKNFISVFRDWRVYPRGSRELSHENLCVTLTTRPSTREQVAKTGQKCFLNFSDFEEKNTFQKHLKHSKIFLCLNQQRLSMWKHISSSTITQMNMAFIEHKLVYCVWI